jgi:hypothetical protein
VTFRNAEESIALYNITELLKAKRKGRLCVCPFSLFDVIRGMGKRESLPWGVRYRVFANLRSTNEPAIIKIELARASRMGRVPGSE